MKEFMYPLAEVRGAQAALDALRAIPRQGVLEAYHLYPAALGEMHFRLGEYTEAARHLERAIALTTSRAEKHYLQEKLRTCEESPTGRA